MESGPAIFAAMVFGLFGAGLLGWTAVCVRHRRPVGLGMGRVTSTAFAGVASAAALALGVWCLGRL
jgi:hypothetical protein